MGMVTVVQLTLIGVWAGTLSLHTRRLYRLAAVPVSADRARYVRIKAQRMWWWLGRDEFWSAMRHDLLRSIEATLMIGILALSF